MITAPAVHSHRRRSLVLPLLLSIPAPVVLIPFSRLIALSLATLLVAALPAAAVPPCSGAGTGWCNARRVAGDVANGELGFRFGEPLDADGDGRADIAAGSRWKLKDDVYQNGVATIWSGATGAKIREWDGTINEGMFGHSVVPIPDLDGDGLADVVIAAPTAKQNDVLHGVVSAHSPKSGKTLWQKTAVREENLGWDMALAGDQNGDGAVDVFVGSPANSGGRVYLLSGKDGSVLRMYAPEVPRWTFGWYVARTDDFDADGHPDLVVGAMQGESEGDTHGAVFLLSTNTGALLRRWDSTDPVSGFGEMVTSMGDLDGDGRTEIAIASSYSADDSRSKPGEVQVFSGVTGKELRHWTGTQAGEYYGRMITSAGDINGDGVDDLAVGAPWHKAGDADKVGRVDIRSGKTGEALAEWTGDGAGSWFGWNIRRAPDPEGKKRPALLIDSLRQPMAGKDGVGVIDWYVMQR
ncbi:MAG TPA: FG-GAP-like repeat-containing protein [Candidatus Limnocylindrales bacterium]|nr:FG-GAP-like repeat-containing protein [Candidatus Limnocylindrales bacterium]